MIFLDLKRLLGLCVLFGNVDIFEEYSVQWFG